MNVALFGLCRCCFMLVIWFLLGWVLFVGLASYCLCGVMYVRVLLVDGCWIVCMFCLLLFRFVDVCRV